MAASHNNDLEIAAEQVLPITTPESEEEMEEESQGGVTKSPRKKKAREGKPNRPNQLEQAQETPDSEPKEGSPV